MLVVPVLLGSVGSVVGSVVLFVVVPVIGSVVGSVEPVFELGPLTAELVSVVEALLSRGSGKLVSPL